MAQDISASEFDEKIKSGKVVVDFWAPWCGPCKQMKPEFEAASEEGGDVTFYKVNVDDEQEAAGKVGIRGVPTVIFYQDGEEVHRFSGAKDKDAILEEVKGAYN